MRAGFLNAVQHLGYQAEVVGISDTDEAAFRSVCLSLLDQNVDGVVMWLPQPDIIRKLSAAGIQVVCPHSLCADGEAYGLRANIAAAPEQIVVGAGTEDLYNLIVQLLGREAVYGVEDPGYSKAARIYALGGARTAPVLVDEGGVSLRSLEMSGAQILHTSPNHQFPTGAVTPIGRRQSLLRWAEAREGRYIIEDDYDSEFRFTLRPIPTLQSIDRAGRVIYVNTFSRTLAPSLRISYMVLPKSLTEHYRAQLGFYSSTVPAMEQHTLARFLDEGYFEAHINRMRKSYRAQRDAVIDTILQSPLGEHCRVSGEDAGLHFLLTIDTKCTDHVLRADAEGRGVRLSFLSDFALRPGSAPQHTLVIHYPGIDLGRLRSALSILEALLYFRDWKYKGRK